MTDRQKKIAAAEALLDAIAKQAQQYTHPEQLDHLAHAYAQVVGSAPREVVDPRRVTVM